MTTSEVVDSLKATLNRPEDDDLFTDPDDYHEALTKAQNYYRRQVSVHYPDLFRVEKGPISSEDGDGEVYDLGDDHLGEIEVWTPPGPPNGTIIPPAVPEAQVFGYYVKGTELHLTYEKDYDPGIYVRWIPATAGGIDADTDPSLPVYFEEALVNRAAFHLASKPGFLGDANFYKLQAQREWSGDPDDPSDSGILGILSRQSAHHGLETLGDAQSRPWYRNIPT